MTKQLLRSEVDYLMWQLQAQGPRARVHDAANAANCMWLSWVLYDQEPEEESAADLQEAIREARVFLYEATRPVVFAR